MSTVWVTSSGVGAHLFKYKFDYIGKLRDQLRSLGCDVLHNYIHEDRGRMDEAACEFAEMIQGYDDVYMAWHSRGGKFCCDVARKSGRPIRGAFSADGWSPGGVLDVPSNILYLAAWYQHEDTPRGSRIHLEGDTLLSDLGPVSGVLHRDMARLPAFVNAVLRSAKGDA
jgi:hypothetical protein